MHKILVLGAGRSAISLFDYLIQNAKQQRWNVTIADLDVHTAKKSLPNSDAVTFLQLNGGDDTARHAAIQQHDLVISMLPAAMHPMVAQDCLRCGKNLVTPSYISKEMLDMDEAVKNAGLTFLNEIGVDPGIDHMSAMRILDELRTQNAEITCFESFTGGLVAPESDDNPWNYKFTWNPRNVVLAGQGGTVKFRHNGMFKYIPYQKLFRRTEVIDIPGYGEFEGYANRDSLNYRKTYGLMDVPTIYRGTLRRRGFCRAWDVFVQLGMTDDSFVMENSESMTHREFINSFLAYDQNDSVELKLKAYLKMDQDSDVFDKLVWLGIFENTPIGISEPATPAFILQKLLEKKWSLQEDDRDMIVMWHKIRAKFPDTDVEKELHSSMVVLGDEQPRTAMAKTVGLPIAIAAKMLLNNNISRKGVVAPVYPDIYNPILDELEKMGISFEETQK